MTSPVTGVVTVRPATPADYVEVGRLTAAAYLESGLISEGSGYGDRLGDAASRARGAVLLVAEVDGELVGSVTFCGYGSRYAEICRPGEAEFRMLAVDPAARGAGVGERLVRAVLARAAEAGVEAVVLSSPSTASAAQRLYTRLGFVRLPERDWWPEPGIHLLAYRLTV